MNRMIIILLVVLPFILFAIAVYQDTAKNKCLARCRPYKVTSYDKSHDICFCDERLDHQ